MRRTLEMLKPGTPIPGDQTGGRSIDANAHIFHAERQLSIQIRAAECAQC